MHALGHLRHPGIHGASENTEVDPSGLEMGGNGQAVRSCSDNSYFALAHLISPVGGNALNPLLPVKLPGESLFLFFMLGGAPKAVIRAQYS
jgi:hypothetical protein